MPTELAQRQARLDHYINSVKHLPPAPTLLVELLDLFKDPDRDLDRIVELISHDPSLTAEVLKSCNSAYFCGGEPAQDIFNAVFRLGFYDVYTLVVAVFGTKTMAVPIPPRVLDLPRLWMHSVQVAATASAIARQAGEPEGVAFTGGLLHDIGKIILAVNEQDLYGGMLKDMPDGGPPLVAAERIAFDVDHAELGARLLTRWNLPLSVAGTVLYHHQLEKGEPGERLAASVHLANELAPLLDEGPDQAEKHFPRDSEAVVMLQLGEDSIPTLIRSALRETERMSGLANLV